jgi:hypothetical protein
MDQVEHGQLLVLVASDFLRHGLRVHHAMVLQQDLKGSSGRNRAPWRIPAGWVDVTGMDLDPSKFLNTIWVTASP